MLLTPDVEEAPIVATPLTLLVPTDQMKATKRMVSPDLRPARPVAHPAGAVAHVRAVPRSSPTSAQEAATLPTVNTPLGPPQTVYAAPRLLRARASDAEPRLTRLFAHPHETVAQDALPVEPTPGLSLNATTARSALDPVAGVVDGPPRNRGNSPRRGQPYPGR